MSLLRSRRQELVEAALDAPEGRVAGLTALAVWLRLAAMRKLTWNRNFNVKPREISAAQVSYMNSVEGEFVALIRAP